MEQFSISDLKKELTKMIGSGENVYSISLFGVASYYMLSVQKAMDLDFLNFLEEIGTDIISDSASEEDEAALLEVSALYYLLSKNTKGFKKAVNWLPGISAIQKKKILEWPESYVLSIFEVKEKDDAIIYKDMRDGKEYKISPYASEIGLSDVNQDKLTLVSLIVPTEDCYLAVPPIFYPVNDLAFAKLKRTKDKHEYEYAVLLEASNYLTELYEEDDFEDVYFDYSHPFYASNRMLGESDKGFAKRLLEQSEFFKNFVHYKQAEKLLIKVIETFPLLFHSDANAHELLEALRLLFLGEQFDEEDLKMASDEVSIFWFALIKKHLSEEVKALEPYIVPNPFDVDNLPF